jgi:hypothetical protein
MKTLIKITALAVITAFAALSCAPDVELTARDWGEKDSERDASLTNNRNNDSTTGVVPTISGTLPLAPSGVTIEPENRELVVRFPVDADFLKASNDQLLSKLNEFLTIFKYTTPDATPPETYRFSKEGDKAAYEFVRRENGTYLGVQVGLVTIRIPQAFLLAQQTTPDATGVIMKIDGAKYTVGGRGLDLDNDGNAGEAIYDDAYVTVSTGWGIDPTWIGPGGPKTLTLTIGSFGANPSSFVAATASRPVTIASIAGGGIGGNTADSTGNLRRKAILEALISKFKVQKFNATSGTWDDFTATITYQNDPAATAPLGGMYGSLVITSFTPEDLGIYRISASGMKGLVTSGQAAFYGVEQKIRVTNTGGNSSSANMRIDNFVSASTGFYSSIRDINANPNASVLNKTYDNSGKKAVFELKFNAINFTPAGGTPTDFYLKEDAEVFKKNVRLAYRLGGGILGNNVQVTQQWVNSTGTFLDVTSIQQLIDDDDDDDTYDTTSIDTIPVQNLSSLISDLDGSTEIRIVQYSSTVSLHIISYDITSTPNTITLSSPIDISGWGNAETTIRWQQTTSTGGNVPIIDPTDVVFVKISDVKFEKISQGTPSVQVATKVTITVDDGLIYGKLKPTYLLLAPGFEYGHANLTFGDFTAIDTVIDGIRGWKAYGSVQ